jgi:hypothetical protein
MEDSNAKRGVVAVHSNLKSDEFEHLDVSFRLQLSLLALPQQMKNSVASALSL